jgi:hypothetical protein
MLATILLLVWIVRRMGDLRGRGDLGAVDGVSRKCGMYVILSLSLNAGLDGG